MKLDKAICTILVVIFLLVGSLSPLQAGNLSDPNMTKWGPKLTKAEIAAIARLSTKELAEMLKTGETLHAYAALDRLTANDGWKRNFDLLLSIAANKRGDMIVEGLVKPIKPSASDEDRRLVDKHLDFLKAQLKKDKPSVSRLQAIRSIARTVFLRGPGPIRSAFRPYKIADANNLKIPHANARVINILTSNLDSTNWRIRNAAIRWLGRVGANDLTKVDNVVTVLNAQLAKVKARKETKAEKAEKQNILRSLIHLKREVQEVRDAQGRYMRSKAAADKSAGTSGSTATK